MDTLANTNPPAFPRWLGRALDDAAAFLDATRLLNARAVAGDAAAQDAEIERVLAAADAAARAAAPAAELADAPDTLRAAA